MRKTFGALSDKLLSVFVAKADVAASCAPDPWYEHCYCRERSDFRRKCHYKPNCDGTCGPCVVYRRCG